MLLMLQVPIKMQAYGVLNIFMGILHASYITGTYKNASIWCFKYLYGNTPALNFKNKTHRLNLKNIHLKGHNTILSLNRETLHPKYEL